MAVGYQVFACEKFPEQDKLQTQDQLTLDLNSDHTLETSSTSLELKLRETTYSEFAARHDFLVRLKYPGRAQGRQFREYVTPYDFPVYRRASADGIGFTPLLVRTKKLVAQDFVGRLNRKIPGFVASGISVDFAALRPRLQDIRGAWFGGMREPNISRAAVFGPNVDRSDEFQHAESVGRLTNIMVQAEIDSLSHMLMFVSEGGIVLYNAYQTVREEIMVIDAALAGVLNGCLTIVPAKTGGT